VISNIGSILLMQAFNGLSLFCVLLLMALGLSIIFGQMGVINMAHGEFMTVGAYTTFVASQVASTYFPRLRDAYFLLAIAGAFVMAFALGFLVEYLVIKRLYRRPLDTLLATWGLSLGMQQAFRSVFGAKEVSATLPAWLMGSYKPTESIDIPLNGLFVMAMTIALTVGIVLLLFRSDFGLQVRATVQNRVMANAVGINTRSVDRVTFALGCGIAGVAGAAFTTIGSTGPTSGSLYIVDTFLVVVFGGAQSLLGTVASAFGIAQAQSISEFFIPSSMAKVLTLAAVIIILMIRPEGLLRAKLRR
jgi:urea transport system permease protein